MIRNNKNVHNNNNPYKMRNLSWLWTIQLLLLLLWTAQGKRRHPLEESILNNNNNNEKQRHLMGSKVNVPVPEGPDDHLVTNLPLLANNNNLKHWAGLLPVNSNKDGYFFYWLFAPDPTKLQEAKDKGLVQENEENLPLLIWLNGGPACSSMDGLWLENGPLRLVTKTKNEFESIQLDPNSWHKAPAYTLYIDQPVGTGLSFTTSGKYPRNDEQVNKDFYYFLQQFLELHSSTLGVKDRKLTSPLFFSGESHAGHYIPSMMNYIRQQNLAQSDNNNIIHIPLSGAAIGNGWFDPIHQYSAHEAAYGYALIDKAQKRALAQQEEVCRAELKAGNYRTEKCFKLLDSVVSNSLGRGNPYKVSQYDQRKWESRSGARDFPPGHKDVEAYLGEARKIANVDVQEVLKAIHASPSWEAGQRYRECTDPPYNALSHQDGLGVVDDVVDLLEDGVKLLFFNGVHDLICNHAGNENALENLPWKHRQEFIEAKRYGWLAPSLQKLGGYMKEYQNLFFLKVLNSGHMVPMDVPEVGLDMITQFLYGQSFDTYPQSLTLAQPDATENCDDNNNNNINSDDATECTQEVCQAQFGEVLSTSKSPILWVGLVASLMGVLCLITCMVGQKKQQQYPKKTKSDAIMEMATYSDAMDDEEFHDEDHVSAHSDDSIRRRGVA